MTAAPTTPELANDARRGSHCGCSDLLKTDVRERPILFSGEMVRAIRAGRKTQTRRAVKLPVIDRNGTGCEIAGCELNSCLNQGLEICPYGKAGWRLWVKETHIPKRSGTIYRADFDAVEAAGLGGMYGGWKPSIFCKRADSRITLEIESVRAERLQEISGPDAIAEGWPREQELYPNVNTNSKAQDWYRRVWEQINGKESWSANPWVWVVIFKEVFNDRLQRPADEP